MKRLSLALAFSAVLSLAAAPALAASHNAKGFPAWDDTLDANRTTIVDSAGNAAPLDASNISASAAAAGDLTNTPVSTVGYAVVQVTPTTMTATSLTASISTDNGTTYTSVRCRNLSAAVPDGSSLVTSTVYECPAGDHFKLTQAGSGATAAKLALKVRSTAPAVAAGQSGVTNSTTTTQTGGYDGSTLVRFATDSDGKMVTQPWAKSGNRWSYAAASSGIANTTTAVTIKAAAGASVRNYVTSCQVQTATLGGATELAIRDGASGTVLWRSQLQTTALPLTSIKFDSPLMGTANTLLEVVTLTAVTGGVYVNCQGFTGP